MMITADNGSGAEGRTTMSATLRLTRDGVGIELRRGTFDVCIDGTSVGQIKWQDPLEVPVQAGRHTLQIKAGRYSSRVLSIEVRDGDTLTFRCHGAMVWPRFVASIVKPDLAIALRRE
jgi:PEGA domain